MAGPIITPVAAPASRLPPAPNAEQHVDPASGSNLGAWPDAPSTSSAPTSDRLTPDSDSDPDDGYDDDGDDDLAVVEGAGLLGGEAYELQDRDPEKAHRRGDVSDQPRDDGYESEEEDAESTRARRRRASVSTTASFQLYTPDEEQAVVRKFDRRLVMFVALLYMLSFLDRSNIGNARIAGMDDDLQSVPPQEEWYEWSLTAFYIAYIMFEWMSLLWKVIPAHIFVSVIVLSWGLTASLQAVAVNYPMLIFLRLLLGIGEAAFTGIPFYLSFFFKRHELAFRTAIFISAAPLASTFASSLAWLIIRLGENSPIAPWRLLFLLEGFPSVFIAVFAWNIIPDSPQTASYLTHREKKVARLRLRHDKPNVDRGKAAVEGSHHSPAKRGLDPRDALSAFADPVAWLTAVMFFLANMAYASLPVFLPTILTSMGHSAESAQALAAPPYLVAFLLVLATAHASDSMRARAPLLIAHALASAAGYGILAFADSRFLHLEPGSMVRYLAVYPAAAGFFNVVVLTIAWTINNQRTESQQGGGFVLMQLIGQCGPLVGTRLYPDVDAPYYTRGMTVCAGAMLGVALLAGVLRWWLGRLNRRLEREEDEGRRAGVEGPEEEEGLVGGPGRGARRMERFRYML